MSSLAELVRQIAEHLLQRRDLSPDLLGDTAARLEGVSARIRELRGLLPQEIEPGVAFDPTHPSLQVPPRIKPEDLARVGGGATGYAAVPAGDAGSAGRPPSGGPGTRPAAPGGDPAEAGGGRSAGASRPEVCAGDDLAGRSIAELLEAIGSRRLSPVELVERTLARIEALQPQLNA
ncbi:MAG TPA: hypothetical protein VF282_06985, partial [Bacillota bacterium]